MPIDTSSYAAAAGAPKTLADYQVENQQVQQNALNLQSGRQKLDAYTTDQNMLNQFRGAFTPGADQTSPAFSNALYAADPQRAAAFMKTQQDQATSRALANKDQGAADESSQKIKDQAFAHYQNALGTIQTPDDAARFITASFHDPIIGPMLQSHGTLEQGLQILQDHSASPDAFKQWLGTASMGMEKMAAATKVNQINTGGTTNTQTYNPITNQTQTVASVQNTVAPDTAANNATSRSNNAANIAKDLTVAGMNPTGGISDNMEGMAQLIASGKAAAPTGMAAARPGVAALMARVAQINPDYDATTYAAKTKAARDFSTGTQGNAMRSFAVSGQHLDQLGHLIDALDNGNNQTINQVGNAISAWNGGTAPTNFDAAKDVVSKEVIKAIVGGGGGVSEREELSKLMSNAKSPAQLKGVIQQYTGLMSAQHDALLQQRRAAGLPDSTMPDYGGVNAGTAPTIGGFTTDAIAAELAKRGHK